MHPSAVLPTGCGACGQSGINVPGLFGSSRISATSVGVGPHIGSVEELGYVLRSIEIDLQLRVLPGTSRSPEAPEWFPICHWRGQRSYWD